MKMDDFPPPPTNLIIDLKQSFAPERITTEKSIKKSKMLREHEYRRAPLRRHSAENMACPGERAPSPPKCDPLPMPRSRQNRVSSGAEPPKYSPAIPLPYMSGYLEKGSGDQGRNQQWSRKYVEVSDGTLRFYNSKEERGDSAAANDMSGVVVPLAESFVSIQNKRLIRLESRSGVRFFRAQTEAAAHRWEFVISRFCSVAPSAEGFCKKMSGGKKVLEDRYLRMAACGILSWFKSDKDDAECRGSLEVRGEKITQDMDDPRTVLIQTGQRLFEFKFLDNQEAMQWYSAMIWHSHRTPIDRSRCPNSSLRN